MAIQNKKSSHKKREPLDKEALIEVLWCEIVNGKSRFEIMKKLENDAYDGFETSKLCRTTKYNYLQEAYENCKVELAEEKEKQRGLFYERILSVYNDAIDARDRANALKALELCAKLSGVYTDKKEVNVTSGEGITIKFGFDKKETEE